MDIGAELRNARNARKLSISEIARVTKISPSVLRAIDKDKAEIVVMPGPGRLLKALMDLFPGFGPAMNRLSGGEKLIALIADQREANHAAKLQRETA